MSGYKYSAFKRYFHIPIHKTTRGVYVLCGEFIPNTNSRGHKALVAGAEARKDRTPCPHCEFLTSLGHSLYEEVTSEHL